MKLIREYNSDVLLKRAREAVNAALGDVKRLHKEALLLCAGGSAFQLLGDISPSVLGRHLTVTVLDERASTEPSVNNFAQLMATTFYREATAAGAHFFDTRLRAGERITDLASRFDNVLKEWCKIHPNGAIIALMGVGMDGHVAGIMRYPEDPALFADLFEQQERWVVGYEASPGKNDFPQRVTTTLPFLRGSVDQAIAFMSGPTKKKDAYTRLMSPTGSLPETPARILHEMKDVVLYSDVI